jgi:hypothetical protein
MKKVAVLLALVAAPALADEALKPLEAGRPGEVLRNVNGAPKWVDEKIVSDLEAQVKGLQEQVQRADAIIGALSRQRNEAMDRAVLMETRALAAETAAKK